MSSTRPEGQKAGQVSLNVPETVADSVDTIFDAFALPKPSPAAKRLTPRYVFDALDIPSPRDMGTRLLENLDSSLGINQPPER